MNKLFITIGTLLLVGCGQQAHKNPHILISTNAGEIEVELYPEQAPKTVAAFLNYIDSGYYNNSAFYRVVLTEGLSPSSNVGLIQGGTWQTPGKPAIELPGIEHEPTSQTGLSHTTGTISLARTTPGSANTEFFICIGDQTQFDFGKGSPADSLGFAAFGKVSKGMTVVRALQLRKKQGESFTPPITINKIKRL